MAREHFSAPGGSPLRPSRPRRPRWGLRGSAWPCWGACGPPCCFAARLPRGVLKGALDLAHLFCAPSACALSQGIHLGPATKSLPPQRFFPGKLSGNCQLIFSRRFRQAHFSLLIYEKSRGVPCSLLLRSKPGSPCYGPIYRPNATKPVLFCCVK